MLLITTQTFPKKMTNPLPIQCVVITMQVLFDRGGPEQPQFGYFGTTLELGFDLEPKIWFMSLKPGNLDGSKLI